MSSLPDPHFKYRLEGRNPSGDIHWVFLRVEEVAGVAFSSDTTEEGAIAGATEYLKAQGYTPSEGYAGIEWKPTTSVVVSLAPQIKQPPEFTYQVFSNTQSQKPELVLDVEDIKDALIRAEQFPDDAEYNMVYTSNGEFVAIRSRSSLTRKTRR